MRSFPTNFAAEKNKRTGISPIWILKLTVDSVDYYLSDQEVTVSGWNGGITTKAWVAGWGAVMEQLAGLSTEVRVADLQVSCLIDPDAATNIETLAVHSTLEKSPAILYLWFNGLDAATDPPQEIFRGYVRDADIPDEITVNLSLEDATVRLHNMVGTLVTATTYANADPDHIGKILPLPYGVVRNVPAVNTVAGLLTALKADITSGASSCAVARPDGVVANTTKFRIGTEIIKVTAVNGDTLTISRAQDSTVAAAHAAGDRLLEVMANPFVFVVSGHALTSIDKVVVRAGDVDIDVTDQCTRYTGQAGSQYSTYGTKGVVTVTEAQAAVIRARVLKAAELALTDPEHAHASELMVVSPRLTGYYVENGSAISPTAMYDQDITTGGTLNSYASQTRLRVYFAFPIALPGKPKRVRICGLDGNVNGDLGLKLYFKGSNVLSVTCSGGVQGTSSWYTISDANQSWLNFLYSATTYLRLDVLNPTTTSASVKEVWMEIEYDPSTSNAGTGITGSVNSVADAMIGGLVHADVTAPCTDPDDVFSDLLTTWGGGVNLTLDGSFPASYTLNGVILAQEKLLDLLHRLAWQCRSWFRLASGAARLVVRPDSLTSEKTLSACRLDGGRMVYGRRKTEMDEVVNTINLRYNRDWTKVDGDDAYLAVSGTTDATSIADYGIREIPDLFRMDMITSSVMADSVRDFYLADLKRRKWLHEFEEHLDHAELEFGDVVTLGFGGDAVVELMQAGVVPGNTKKIDVIRIVGRGQ